jgi:hypothetical protein
VSKEEKRWLKRDKPGKNAGLKRKLNAIIDTSPIFFTL